MVKILPVLGIMFCSFCLYELISSFLKKDEKDQRLFSSILALIAGIFLLLSAPVAIVIYLHDGRMRKVFYEQFQKDRAPYEAMLERKIQELSEESESVKPANVRASYSAGPHPAISSRNRVPSDAKVSITIPSGDHLRVSPFHADRIFSALDCSASPSDPDWIKHRESKAIHYAISIGIRARECLSENIESEIPESIVVIWSSLYYSVLDILISNKFSYEIEDKLPKILRSAAIRAGHKEDIAFYLQKIHDNVIQKWSVSPVDPSSSQCFDYLIQQIVEPYGFSHSVDREKYIQSISELRSMFSDLCQPK